MDLKYKIKKRFFVVTSIIGILYTSLTLLLYAEFEQHNLLKFLWFLNIGVAIWFFIEDKMLRDFHLYLAALFISLCIIGYNLTLSDIYNFNPSDYSISSSLHALVLLLIQWPLRKIFLSLFKVEPIVERTGNVKNIAYTFVLAVGMMVIPFLLEDLFNQFYYR